MSYSYAPLGPANNSELLTLAASLNTGSDAFVVDRTPNFFALGRDFGEAAYWGAYAGDRLVGCVGLTRQIRFLGGGPRDVHYLHDLRIDPAHRRSPVLHGLLLQMRRAFSGRWVFSTILDGNPHAGVLTRASRAFPAARPIGCTTHVGAALFVPQPGEARAVVSLDADSAWKAYAALAWPIDFAPADEARFRSGEGPFLGFEQSGSVVAVCKVVDQSASRKLVATKPLAFAARMASLGCRLRGRALLPGAGQPLRHAYLAYCVGRRGVAYRDAFVSYLSRKQDHDFTYAFFGLPAADAALAAGFFTVKLGSTTFAYGDAPDSLALSFHELTLV